MSTACVPFGPAWTSFTRSGPASSKDKYVSCWRRDRRLKTVPWASPWNQKQYLWHRWGQVGGGSESVRDVKINWLSNNTRAKKLSGSRVVSVGFLCPHARWRGLYLGRLGVRIPPQARDFLFTKASRLPLGHNQPPIQWLCWGFSESQYHQGLTLTPYFHLMPRLRIRGAIPPLRGPG